MDVSQDNLIVSFSSHNDPYQVILINFSPYESLSGNNNIIRQQDMEPDRGGKLKGVNGGRGKRVRRVGEFADPEHRRLVVGQGLEREHKSNKRFHTARSSRGGQWGWDQLSAMAQHAFTMNIACPRITYLDGIEPDALELARLAPIHWGDMGIPFNREFSQKQERFAARAWGTKSDIQEHPDRDAMDPANDPCAYCKHMVCVCVERE